MAENRTNISTKAPAWFGLLGGWYITHFIAFIQLSILITLPDRELRLGLWMILHFFVPVIFDFFLFLEMSQQNHAAEKMQRIWTWVTTTGGFKTAAPARTAYTHSAKAV